MGQTSSPAVGVAILPPHDFKLIGSGGVAVAAADLTSEISFSPFIAERVRIYFESKLNSVAIAEARIFREAS